MGFFLDRFDYCWMGFELETLFQEMFFSCGWLRGLSLLHVEDPCFYLGLVVQDAWAWGGGILGAKVEAKNDKCDILDW